MKKNILIFTKNSSLKNMLNFFFVFMLTGIFSTGFALADSNTIKNTDREIFTNNIKSETAPHFEKKIGHLSNGNVTFETNPETLKQKWAQTINNASGLALSFDEIEFSFENQEWYLRAYNSVNKTSSIIKLVLDGEFLYEYKHYEINGKEAGAGYTVTCSGCKSTGQSSAGECEVYINPGVGYYCTDCSDGDCIKTTTYNSGAGITD